VPSALQFVAGRVSRVRTNSALRFLWVTWTINADSYRSEGKCALRYPAVETSLQIRLPHAGGSQIARPPLGRKDSECKVL
jgi:hypothetical protein